MNKGEILNNAFSIIGGEDGSFVIVLDEHEGGILPAKAWGFSNIGDLLHWMNEEADAWQKLAKPLGSTNG